MVGPDRTNNPMTPDGARVRRLRNKFQEVMPSGSPRDRSQLALNIKLEYNVGEDNARFFDRNSSNMESIVKDRIANNVAAPNEDNIVVTLEQYYSSLVMNAFIFPPLASREEMDNLVVAINKTILENAPEPIIGEFAGDQLIEEPKDATYSVTVIDQENI